MALELKTELGETFKVRPSARDTGWELVRTNALGETTSLFQGTRERCNMKAHLCMAVYYAGKYAHKTLGLHWCHEGDYASMLKNITGQLEVEFAGSLQEGVARYVRTYRALK